MAVYKSIELFNKICEILNDGYEYVEVTDLDNASLSFEAIADEIESIDYEEIDSCDIPDDYDFDKPSISISSDSFCYNINFTYKEIATISHAVNNALAYFKDCLEDSSCSRDVRDEIKASSVECRNLQAKLNRLLKHIK